MGMGSWTASTNTQYRSYAADVAKTTSAREAFRSRHLVPQLDPKGVLLRESCDSEINPESNAIIIGLDVTGSMGSIAHHIAKEGLGTLMTEIMDRQPVSNPHIMFMGIGDAAYDDAPLQVSQFEPDIRIVEQLSQLYIEEGGGGNATESYDLPWYFAGTRTSIDCFNKRQRKGYLFTIGDELPPTRLAVRDLTRTLGSEQHDVSSAESLRLAQEKYHVFHFIIEEGSYARRSKEVIPAWKALLGARAVCVKNFHHISQIIISTMEVSEGGNPEEVIASWEDPAVRDSVKHALFA